MTRFESQRITYIPYFTMKTYHIIDYFMIKHLFIQLCVLHVYVYVRECVAIVLCNHLIGL